MIKVNLLRAQAGAKRGPALPKKSLPRAAPILLAVILLPIAGLTGWWFSLKSEIGTLNIRRDELKAENQRLQALKKQLAQYEKMKQERESRINIIETLRKNQTGPVLLLNAVIQSLPTNATVWLTNLEQKGDRIQITGFTVRGESVPDFMSNLAATGHFRTVDLELYEDQLKDKETNAAARFRLVCMTFLKSPGE